jgi:hypothetical protein
MTADVAVQDAPVADDVTGDLQLIAMNPADMQVAQGSLVKWFESKIAILKRDVSDLETNLQIAADHGWKTETFDRQLRHATGRVEFYEKCKAAAEAGYCIVPNFPVDVFAIRTNRRIPRKEESDYRWGEKKQSSEAPAMGEGHYTDSLPVIHQRTGPGREIDKSTGKPKEITTYFAHHFQEIDFPISVARPAIMSETSRAMALKCFDELGVLPSRRGKGDPIVVGIVKHKGSAKRTMFLVAWYIDTKDL